MHVAEAVLGPVPVHPLEVRGLPQGEDAHLVVTYVYCILQQAAALRAKQTGLNFVELVLGCIEAKFCK